ncbi:hypothetical protein Ppb6_03270 [Photorhabdus australis subsp. thailandensis]|uniref:Uncharacterized protein n=1 Tax=Photorhabdus australis subsp. thailandensis TaxID=2805096 RepID=A0A1C0U0U1_9GAMM|nr:hypothetical protein Ppb6_03270 [Photorhabdus australis subsp. thailandensis]
MKWYLEIGTLVVALLPVGNTPNNKNNENNRLFLFDWPIEILAFFYFCPSSNI